MAASPRRANERRRRMLFDFGALFNDEDGAKKAGPFDGF
jgi:hypothetical protein